LKPLEIYNLLVTFRNVMDDQGLTNQMKLEIGQEVLRSLPSPLQCDHQSKSTLEAVTAAIKERLKQMEEQENDRRSKAREETEEAQSQGKSPRKAAVEGDKGPSKKPVRKDAAH
jgi:hypothetical protein